MLPVRQRHNTSCLAVSFPSKNQTSAIPRVAYARRASISRIARQPPPAPSRLRSHRYPHASRKPPPHACPHQSPAPNKPSPPPHHPDAPPPTECPPYTAHLAPRSSTAACAFAAPPLPPHPARSSAPHQSVRHKQPRRPRSPPSHRNVPSRSAEVSSLSPEPTSNKLLTPQHHNRRSPKVYRASTQNPQHPAQHRTAVTPNETSKTLFLRLP